MLLINKNKGFTLIEILVGILIISIVILGGFKALSAITIGKVRLIQKTELQKENFYFTEKLFEMIKKGGTIDYEEYFNRKVIGNTNYSLGHFSIPSGFGNYGNSGNVGTVSSYGDEFYYCRSGNDDTKQLGYDGCYLNDDLSYGVSSIGNHQRYGQYSFQFIDYNSNYNADILLGDEDGDGYIIGDDDDEYLGDGPVVFTSGINTTELYLISGDKKSRTLFRWSVKLDPKAPSSVPCSINTSNIITSDGCIGNIEYLKLDGMDWGMEHIKNPIDKTYLDGVIDTWIINENLKLGNPDIVAGYDTDKYWVPLFSDSINITEFEVYPYPNKDIYNAWANSYIDVNISPYVILKLKMKPSWKSRIQIRGDVEELEFSMTINLSEIYSQ